MALLAPSVSYAVDPQSVQAYCDEIKKSAQDAQLRYIQTYQPRTDPGKTFEDATTSCLDFINKFNVGFSFNIPSLGDITNILQQAAQQMLQKACQSAAQQFNKAVSDAQQSVGQATTGVNQLPGVNVGMQTGSSLPSGVSTVIKTDNGSTLKNAATNTATNVVDRVINFLK
jgi:hypothetical protein